MHCFVESVRNCEDNPRRRGYTQLSRLRHARDQRRKMEKIWSARASRPFKERLGEDLAMPNIHVLTGAGESPAYPVVRKIGVADLKDAVAKGIDDFMAMPTHVIFLAVIYPLVGLFLAGITFGHNVVPLLYPLAAGFALIGPFAAIGLYEVSRQRERGVEASWKDA